MDLTFYHDPNPAVPRRTSRVACGNCPFRGQVSFQGAALHFPLDERCPATVRVHQVRSGHTHRTFEDNDPKKPVIDWHGDPPAEVPLLEKDTYCYTCVHEVVREREAGMNIKPHVSAGPSNRLTKRGPSRRKLARRLAGQLRRSS